MWKLVRKPVRYGILLLLLLAASCADELLAPAKLSPGEDSCAHCRMAVSQIEFAAQCVSAGLNPKFYDDVGCLVLDLGNLPEETSKVLYVADFETHDWLDVNVAHFVMSKNIESPMGYGIAAFADASRASQLANTGEGQLLNFSDLTARLAGTGGT